MMTVSFWDHRDIDGRPWIHPGTIFAEIYREDFFRALL